MLQTENPLNKCWAAIVLSALMLTGCSAKEADTFSGAPSATSAQVAPDIVGQTLAEAATAMAMAGLDYDYFQDGQRLSVGVGEYKDLVVASTDPRAGETLPAGSKLKINAAANPTIYASNPTEGPATLRAALAAASRDHTDVSRTIGAMQDLYRQAEKSLQSNMTAGAWGELDIIRINTTLGALRDSMTVREVVLGVKRYALAVEAEAVRQKLA